MKLPDPGCCCCCFFNKTKFIRTNVGISQNILSLIKDTWRQVSLLKKWCSHITYIKTKLYPFLNFQSNLKNLKSFFNQKSTQKRHSIKKWKIKYYKQIVIKKIKKQNKNIVTWFVFLGSFKNVTWKVKVYKKSWWEYFGILWRFGTVRAVTQRCSVKKVVLEISQNSQENTCARVSFLIKLQACNFIKKENLARVVSSEFCEISKNSFSYRAPLVVASVQILFMKKWGLSIIVMQCGTVPFSMYSRTK